MAAFSDVDVGGARKFWPQKHPKYLLLVPTSPPRLRLLHVLGSHWLLCVLPMCSGQSGATNYLNITVSDPVKQNEGINAYITYKVGPMIAGMTSSYMPS